MGVSVHHVGHGRRDLVTVLEDEQFGGFGKKPVDLVAVLA